jgi:hypothetical protein
LGRLPLTGPACSFTPPAIQFLQQRLPEEPWRLTTYRVRRGGSKTLNANIPG